MGLTKEQILAAADYKIEEVKVPEWGGSVFIKLMSGREREKWETDLIDKKHKYNVRTSLLVRSLCDEAGKELFTLAEVDALGQKSSHVIDMLFEKVQDLNKVTKKDIDDLGNDSPPIN